MSQHNLRLGPHVDRTEPDAGMFDRLDSVTTPAGLTSERIVMPSASVGDRPGVLAPLRAGDGPLSVRVRPSSIKRDCGRRATSTGETYLVNGHAKSLRLTLAASADTPVRNQGPGGSLPGPDAGHPLHGAGGAGVEGQEDFQGRGRSSCH